METSAQGASLWRLFGPTGRRWTQGRSRNMLQGPNIASGVGTPRDPPRKSWVMSRRERCCREQGDCKNRYKKVVLWGKTEIESVVFAAQTIKRTWKGHSVKAVSTSSKSLSSTPWKYTSARGNPAFKGKVASTCGYFKPFLWRPKPSISHRKSDHLNPMTKTGTLRHNVIFSGP